MNDSLRYIHIDKPYAISIFTQRFEKVLSDNIINGYSDVVILCIGTDRSTGDCLGPLVGQKLKHIKSKGVQVYGTLDEPVHAKNLKSIMKDIHNKYDNPFIISIDACLGKTQSVGCISVDEGPITPGAGVNKNLPEVGHIHVIGIVNVGGFMEYIILQNTRLSLVMRMSEIISMGIYHCLSKYMDRVEGRESSVKI